jgi:hypothetical protein
MDYYHKDIAPHVYYFDSLQELAKMTRSKGSIDFKNVKKSGPAFMEKVRRKTVSGWRDLFTDMGYSL